MTSTTSLSGGRALASATVTRTLALTCLSALTLSAAGATVAAAPPADQRSTATAVGGHVWLDADGEPLPFESEEQLLELLRTAPFQERMTVLRGVAGARKVTLEDGDLRVHAVFRDVDVTKATQPPEIRSAAMMGFRDSAMFEAAAYELSRLLGLDRVPPAVPRTHQGRKGTLQIWMEGTITEIERESIGASPPDVERWNRQVKIMNVWDSLIGNTDRNRGNMLIDRRWNVWFIDHTRAFINSQALVGKDQLTACDRDLWQAIQDLDEEKVRSRLGPYLSGSEVKFLLKRRARLVKHFQRLIDEQGEGAVLYSVPEPGPELAEWPE